MSGLGFFFKGGVAIPLSGGRTEAGAKMFSSPPARPLSSPPRHPQSQEDLQSTRAVRLFPLHLGNELSASLGVEILHGARKLQSPL